MVSFKLFAGTDIGLRDNNEDNFTVCPDLTLGEWSVPANHQQAISLGKRGCVVVVADGMGGQNAGEVASDIAIKTVEEMFSPSMLPTDVTEKPDAIKDYLKKVIEEADIRVKQHSKEHPATAGMGSTIIIAWLVGNMVYVAWLGDSRAYSYVPGKGIGRLSKDHSYVQQLVDAKVLTEEQAMNDPNSNIITRSLGDPSQKAKPDVVSCSIKDGEIILLCSDGLCGVCKDEEIGGIIEAESGDLQICKEKLTIAALTNGGSDNITIVLLQIVDAVPSEEQPQSPQKTQSWKDLKKLFYPIGVLILLCLIGSLYGLYCMVTSSSEERITSKDSIQMDSSESTGCFDTVTPTLKDGTDSSFLSQSKGTGKQSSSKEVPSTTGKHEEQVGGSALAGNTDSSELSMALPLDKRLTIIADSLNKENIEN